MNNKLSYEMYSMEDTKKQLQITAMITELYSE